MDWNKFNQLLFTPVGCSLCGTDFAMSLTKNLRIFKAIGMGSSAGLFATGIYGVVKVVVTAIGLAFMTEQLGRKWSLIIGALGQAFAMFYIGINQAVNPVSEGAALNGNSIFAIICVYLFVVFYSFGWGPIPFVLSSECAVSTHHSHPRNMDSIP